MSFKIYAYFFGGLLLIIGAVIEIKRQLTFKEYDALIFGLIPIIIGIIWIKEAIKKYKENATN